MTDEVQITRLGAQGDGIAETREGIRFVPFALPGEQVLPQADAMPEIVGSPSFDRVAPLCRHFGVCGGCAAQHMRQQLYAEWKRAILADALRQQRLEAEVAPLVAIGPASRRRAILAAQREGNAVRLGYHRRRSSDLVDIAECPVLVPAISSRLPVLRAIVQDIGRRDARLTVLATKAGLDVAIEQGGRRPSPDQLLRVAAIARQGGIARTTVGGELVAEHAVPRLSFSGVDVVPPPGAFVQAAEPAETLIAGIIIDSLSTAKRVVDLFCGIGTWTLAIARHARVLAVDGDRAALGALETAVRGAQGLKPVETKVRDLFREPFSAQELKGFDAVVFDPPRAGARAQAERLARSDVGAVVAVSCDPGTLARDLRILVDGGYRIGSVTPVDQFVYSAHVEAVAVLRRKR